MTEFISLSKINPDPSNEQHHPRSQIDLIKKWIVKSGFTLSAIVFKENGGYTISAGHGRYKAVSELHNEGVDIYMICGTKIPLGTLPCNVFSDKHSKLDADSYRVWDNRSSELSNVDKVKLKDTYEDLKLREFDVSLLSLDLEDLKEEEEKPVSDTGNISFSLNKTGQIPLVKDALLVMGTNPAISSQDNDSIEGNALYFICKFYLDNIEK